MRWTHCIVVAALLVISGCARFGNRGEMVDVLVRPSEGESIGTAMEVQMDWRGRRTDQGPGEWFWKRGADDSVTLDVRPGGDSTVVEGVRRINSCGDALRVHTTARGGRVWLTCEGKVLAGFDRQARTGTVGEGDHPDWAKKE